MGFIPRDPYPWDEGSLDREAVAWPTFSEHNSTGQNDVTIRPEKDQPKKETKK